MPSALRFHHGSRFRKRWNRGLWILAGIFYLVLIAITVKPNFQATRAPAESYNATQMILTSSAQRRHLLFAQVKLETCTQYCPPTGGTLSISGYLSGQCDCDVRQLPQGGYECMVNEGQPASTCCSSLDDNAGAMLYFAIILYMFFGLAIICDDYFCTTLDKLTATFGLSDDVAGATFMAIGSSAPELATAIVATLISGGKEGIGTIVGSAIFNVMVISGVTGICAKRDLDIWWYPLTRDVCCYVIAVVCIYGIVWDGYVSFMEATICVALYFGYILLMMCNSSFVARLQSAPENLVDTDTDPKDRAEAGDESLAAEEAEPLVKDAHPDTHTSQKLTANLGGNEMAGNETFTGNNPMRPTVSRYKLLQQAIKAKSLTGELLEKVRKQNAGLEQTFPVVVVKDVLGCIHSSDDQNQTFPSSTKLQVLTKAEGMLFLALGSERNEMPLECFEWRELLDVTHDKRTDVVNIVAADGRQLKLQSPQASELEENTQRWKSPARTLDYHATPSTNETDGAATSALVSSWRTGYSGNKHATVQQQTCDDPSPSVEASEPMSPAGYAFYVVTMPLQLLFRMTVPDCNKTAWASWYPVSFAMSVLWITLLCMVMVDFSVRLGCVLNVPGLLMGLVVLAAGTSVPDCLSSVAVARSGLGDMAVANILGSNVFDILLGLGIPWMIKTCMDGSPMHFEANGLFASIIMLVLYVFILYGSIMGSGWKLTKEVGYILLAFYFVFVALSVLVLASPTLVQLPNF